MGRARSSGVVHGRALACATVLALFVVGAFVGPATAAAPLPYVGASDEVSVEPVVGQPGYLDFTFSVRSSTQETVSVEYKTMDGTARAGTIVLQPGTTKTLRVRLKSDDVAEGDESLTLALSNPVNAQLGFEPFSTGTINDVGDPLVLNLPDGYSAYVEPDAGQRVNVFILVSLDRPAPPGVDFELTYVDGTAVARQDYSPGAETRRFAVGRSKDRVQMTIRGDDIPEGTETFSVTVTADGATVANDTITITILDND